MEALALVAGLVKSHNKRAGCGVGASHHELFRKAAPLFVVFAICRLCSFNGRCTSVYQQAQLSRHVHPECLSCPCSASSGCFQCCQPCYLVLYVSTYRLVYGGASYNAPWKGSRWGTCASRHRCPPARARRSGQSRLQLGIWPTDLRVRFFFLNRVVLALRGHNGGSSQCGQEAGGSPGHPQPHRRWGGHLTRDERQVPG